MEHHYLIADMCRCGENGVDKHLQELCLVLQSTLPHGESLDQYERMPEELEKEWDRISVAQSRLLEDAQESGLFPYFNNQSETKI